MKKYYLDSNGLCDMFDTKEEAFEFAQDNDWYDVDDIYDKIADYHGISDMLEALREGRQELYFEWYNEAFTALFNGDLREVDFCDDEEEEEEDGECDWDCRDCDTQNICIARQVEEDEGE